MCDDAIRVLVTGFGAFQEAAVNPSFEIVKRLPSSLPGIEIIPHPEALPAVYHSLLELSPRLIQQYNPKIVIHIGLCAERDYFAVERSAYRDGYHEFPDMERKVVPKSEIQKIWGKKSAERITSSFDLEQVVQTCRQKLISQTAGRAKKGKTNKVSPKEEEPADIRLSDDVGNYVCGLVYYASLVELSKRSDTERNVIFLHVPPLSSDLELEKGKQVVLSLVMALVESIL